MKKFGKNADKMRVFDGIEWKKIYCRKKIVFLQKREKKKKKKFDVLKRTEN